MKRIREILLNEYIGAIAIGFLLAQAVGEIIGIILLPVSGYLTSRGRPYDPFATSFSWIPLIRSVVSLVLRILAAGLLLYWLYLKKPPQPDTVTEISSNEDSTEQS